MTPQRLSRGAFIVILIIVGVWLLFNLPPVEEVGTTPSSEFITFAIHPWVTETHRKIKRAKQAEAHGDSLREISNRKSKRKYGLALKYLKQAEKSSKRYPPGGYIKDLIDKSLSRIKAKIRKNSR